MSRTIDERVVEMRFDNKQFEANAKESIGTLTKLREALNLSTKNSAKSLEGLDKAAKSVSLEGIAAGVEALQKRFSTLGIVGMRVIENITDSMMNTLGRGINFVSDSIVSGGIRRAMNLENAHFQLQALLKDEVKVQEVMANANTAVDGTAYALDEAAKAASQFAASGIQAGEEMTNALRGVVGVSAMTNSEFSSVAQIFATVAGNGRLMGDQLLQLGARGLNAAATIADFVNGVRDGSKSASDEVTSLVKNFNDGMKVTEQDIRELVSDGQISFKLFSEAMTDAFADSAERANETFTGALSNIKSALARIGAGFISPLVAQNSEVVLLFNAVRERVNDVKKALVFDEEIGNVNALSKQFTDTVLSMAKYAAEFIRNVDLSKPMEVFYYWVETIKNLGKGLWTFLKPLGQAFRDVFLAFSMDDVVNLSAKIEQLTSNMRFTDQASSELRDAFKGLFSVVKLVVDVIVDIVRIFVPFNSAANTATAGIIGFAGAMGRGLSTFTEWFRNSKMIGAIYNGISNTVRAATTSFGDFLNYMVTFGKEIYEMKEVQDLLENISKSFNQLGNMAWNTIVRINDKLVEWKFKIFDLIPSISGGNGLKGAIADMAKWMNNALNGLKNIDLSKPKAAFESFKVTLKSLLEVLKGNQGLNTFVANMKKFFQDLAAAFSIDKILEKIETFRNTIDSFITWLKDKLAPLADVFQDFSLGGALSTAGGIGLIYAIIKVSKSFEKVASTLEKIPNILGSINGVLKEYQVTLKAETLKKVAAAILMLSGALVLLSFADMEQVMKAAVALSITAGVLLVGVNKFLDVAQKTRSLEDAIYKFGQAANNLAKAVKWKAIGSTFTSFATAILIIVGSLGAIAFMYRKDPEAIMMAGDIVEYIAGAMLAVIGVMSLLGKLLGKGMQNFSKAAYGVLGLSLSLIIVVGALQTLLNMYLPLDYEKKLTILAEIFAGLGLMAVVVGLASRISGENKINAAPILALCAMLYTTVLALEKLFGMYLPLDWETKLNLLGEIFVGLGALVIAVGAASKLAGGALKATGTILAMCAFVGTAVGSLIILSIFPAEKMIAGAVSLAILLGTLGLALAGAGRIVGKDVSKSVLNMALSVASIVVALGALSLIPLPLLIKSGVALGVLLTILAADFAAVGSIKNDKAHQSILSMVAALLAVTVSLTILAEYPWDSLLLAAVSLSGTLLAMAGAMDIISKSKVDTKSIGAFAAGAVAMIPMAFALTMLAKEDWQGILVSMTAIILTCVGLSSALLVLSAGKSINMTAIAGFVAGAVAMIPMGVALAILAKESWQGILAAMGAMVLTCVGLASALAIISATSINPIGILAFVTSAVALVPIAFALNMLTGLSWGDVAKGLITLAGALTIIGVAGLLLGPISPLILAFSAALLVFGAAIAVLGVGLLTFVASLVTSVQLMQQLPAAFVAVLGQMYEAGKNIITGIIQGIVDGLQSLLSVIADVGKSIVQTFMSVLGIHSPSTVMQQLGLYTDQGFAMGLLDGQGEIDSTIEQVFGSIEDKIDLSGLYTAGENATSEFTGGMTSNEGNIQSSLASGLQAGLSALDDSGYRTTGEKASNEFLGGLNIEGMDLSSMLGSAVNGMDLSSFNLSGGLSSEEFLNGFGSTDMDFSSILNGSVSGIDMSQFSTTGEQASTEFTTGFQNGSINSVNQAATNVATLFCTVLREAFTSRIPQVSTGMMTQLMSTLSTASAQLTTVGTKAGNFWVTGFKTTYPAAITAGQTLAKQVITQLNALIPQFLTKGSSAASQYLTGIRNQYGTATSTGTTLANNVLSGIKSVDFTQAGKNAGQGFIDGLKSMTSSASAAGKAIGQAAYDSAKKALEVKSPSRKMYEVGEFAGLGFVNALMYMVSKAANAGEELGDATLQGASDAISSISRIITDDMVEDPIIRPIVDLSNVEQSVSQISDLFNKAIRITAINADSVAGTISARGRNISGGEIQNQQGAGTINNFNFEQINNSPKPLSRSEIYRQTKNLFSSWKGAVEA